MSDADIKKYLGRIKLVQKMDDKYYSINETGINKILGKPRGVSLTFDAAEVEKEPLIGFSEYKRVTYLVKSSSRFFLRPDVGEIFDQIDIHELWSDKLKGICFDNDYQLLDGTEGEHFLMTATLLTDPETWPVNVKEPFLNPKS